VILKLIDGSGRVADEKTKDVVGALPCLEHLSVELDFNDLSALYEE
jgi:hypothetical protein